MKINCNRQETQIGLKVALWTVRRPLPRMRLARQQWKMRMAMVPTRARLGRKGNDLAGWKISKSVIQTGRVLGAPP